MIYSLKKNGVNNFKWLNYIESIFNDTGLRYIFENQIEFIDNQLITQVLRDQFIQKWFSDIRVSSRGIFYSTFKKEFGLEKYLIKLPEQNRVWICKLRTSNLPIPIETGRWFNILKEARICTLCQMTLEMSFICYLHAKT